MTIDITPIVSVFFDLLIFGIGLDFVWCGYWYSKTKETMHLPRLLGFVMIKIFEIGNRKSKSKNELARNIFSMRAVSVYLLLVGFRLMADGAFRLWSKFPK